MILRRTPQLLPFCAIALVAGAAMWMMAPLASGALAPASSSLRLEVDVPVSTSVTPGWKTGDDNVRIKNLSIPGMARDATSDGWRMSTNWENGYEVRIRSTSDPALRGQNAVDGRGANASFTDYATAGCPCPWSGKGADAGIFGYSVSVTSSGGKPAVDTPKWGTARERLWRGFTKEPYRAYATQGGSGQYTMAIHLRSMIPDGAVQVAGSYRSGLVVSAHPLL